MTARILVVDDELDVEALVLQKFRHRIRDGVVSFLFARDGVEALAALRENGSIDLVVYRFSNLSARSKPMRQGQRAT